jgi:ribosomal protein S12 methylthiotransferase
MLERMRRPERQATIRERVGWLRASVPDLTLRTTVIVGFPGETDEDFDEMLALLEEVRFDRIGAFAYSKEEGTRAAEMAEQVPQSVMRERLERLLEVQAGISLERNERHVGRTVRVLVDGTGADGSAVGRTAGQALEVDGVTLLRRAAGCAPGDMVDARIVDALEEDLIAELVT